MAWNSLHLSSGMIHPPIDWWYEIYLLAFTCIFHSVFYFNTCQHQCLISDYYSMAEATTDSAICCCSSHSSFACGIAASTTRCWYDLLSLVQVAVRIWQRCLIRFVYPVLGCCSLSVLETQLCRVLQCWHWYFRFGSTRSSNHFSFCSASSVRLSQQGCSCLSTFSAVDSSSFVGTLCHSDFALLTFFVFEVVSAATKFARVDIAFDADSFKAPYGSSFNDASYCFRHSTVTHFVTHT